MRLIDFLEVKYRDGARGENGFYDCWGLTRAVRHKVYKKPLLQEFAGISRFTGLSLARAAIKVTSGLKQIEEPIAGAVVGVYKGRICHHAAVVIENAGKLCIMDLSPQGSVKIHTIDSFKRFYSNYEIRYYD